MIHTKNRRPATRLVLPHFGNILNELMNTSMDNLVKNTPKSKNTPSVNVVKKEDAYNLTMALPGYKKEEVEIKVEKNLLIISSNKEAETDEKFRLREYNYGKFERRFHLPKNVNRELIEASFENGLLELTLALKPEAQPKTIAIK